jgi:hypothetical protein
MDPLLDSVAVFSILVGISIVVFWANLYFGRKLYESNFSRSRIETNYHVAAELITAAILVLGGTGVILTLSWGVAVTFAGLGMLLYANVNGIGFYIAKGDNSMIKVFWVVIALTSLAILVLLRAY